MRPFTHVDVSSVEEAVAALDEYGEKAAVIAGGTDLLGALKDCVRPLYPEALVNVKTIPGLAYVEEDSRGLRIGALTKLHAMATDARLREKYSLLAEAARVVASPQVRRMGTIGGNICQEVRCWYYRNPENTFHCLRKGGEVCNAFTGESRYHSIFGAARVTTPSCSSSCPAGVDIPAYMEQIRQGQTLEAARILLETNPLPAVTGRVCPHLCEDGCVRGLFDEAVSVRSVERFMGDYALESVPELFTLPERESGKRVAIVGSGPTGLSAAYYLRTLGHSVTMYDKATEPGGMLLHTIPAYRLPKDVVREVVNSILSTGVEFKAQTDVGVDVTVEEIRKEFDSVLLATGAWARLALDIPGKGLAGFGLDFLIDVNRGLREVPGPRLLVIGGGNVAVDVATTALRLGARKVIMACLECREEMPALERDIEQAVGEGVTVMPSWGPAKILESKGKVTGVELVQCTSVFDENACFAPTFDDSVRETVKVDQVIVAIGQGVDLGVLGSESAVETGGGVISADPETQATSAPGVFAGGDATSGRGTVVEAIGAGRRAALAIDAYLGRSTATSEESEGVQPLLSFDPACLQRSERVPVPELPLDQRTVEEEDVLSLRLEEARREASRCFDCGCVAVCPSDIAPALVALDARIKTTKRTIAAEEFFHAGLLRSTVLDPDELVVEIEVPAPKPGSKQAFLKYRLRKSIDFPIVAVASVLTMDGESIEEARLVLGAVAPIPIRAREAEGYLRGKPLTREVAKAAAALAVEGALPLAKNGYKVQVTRALVERAILAST
jgi:NADPH-dependent glutamate synthase beta subunit-like oxidoreductase